MNVRFYLSDPAFRLVDVWRARARYVHEEAGGTKDKAQALQTEPYLIRVMADAVQVFIPA